MASTLFLTGGCSSKPPAGTGTPESRTQAATLVRDRELELTALRAEMAATRIAAAKKEAELQDLRDIVQQLRLENAESRQAFLELRDQAEQRQRELEKAREEQERQAHAHSAQDLSILKDTVVTMAQELGQLRQELAKPVAKERGKPVRPGASKPPDSIPLEPRADTPQRMPSALKNQAPTPTGVPAVRTVSSPAMPEKAPTITVQPNDTLWSLAKRHRTSVTVLQELNQLEGEALEVGMVLVLPTPPSSP